MGHAAVSGGLSAPAPRLMRRCVRTGALLAGFDRLRLRILGRGAAASGGLSAPAPRLPGRFGAFRLLRTLFLFGRRRPPLPPRRLREGFLTSACGGSSGCTYSACAGLAGSGTAFSRAFGAGSPTLASSE